jgi:hypothetical protein
VSNFLYTNNNLLSGILNISTDWGVMLVNSTTDLPQNFNYNYLAEIPNHQTNPRAILNKTGHLGKSTYDTSFGNGVALSASPTVFQNITGTKTFNSAITYQIGSSDSDSLVASFHNLGQQIVAPASKTLTWGAFNSVFIIPDKGNNQSTTTDFYRKARLKLLTNGFTPNIFTPNALKVALLNGNYIPNYVNHEFYTDIEPYVVAERTIKQIYLNHVNGIAYLHSEPVIFPNLVGDTITQVVVYSNGGDPNTNSLICRIFPKISGYTDLPYTPTGESVELVFHNNIIIILG